MSLYILFVPGMRHDLWFVRHWGGTEGGKNVIFPAFSATLTQLTIFRGKIGNNLLLPIETKRVHSFFKLRFLRSV